MRFSIALLLLCLPLSWAAPAHACSYATSYWPAVATAPADGWIWVFSFGGERDFALESEAGTLPLVVQEVVSGRGGEFIGLAPESPPTAGRTYRLVRLGEDSPSLVDYEVSFTDPVGDDAPPDVMLARTGYVLFDLVDSCATGRGDTTLYLCGVDESGAASESRLVNAAGEVVARRVGTRGAYFNVRVAAPAELTLEVRGIGPRGARGPWVPTALASIEGYRLTGAPSGGLVCEAELTLGSEPLATSESATPVSMGGCGSVPAPGAGWPLLALFAWRLAGRPGRREPARAGAS